MTDQVLNILKFVLLGLLYLFFARVLWAVWSEVRTPVRRQQVAHPQVGQPQGTPGSPCPPARRPRRWCDPTDSAAPSKADAKRSQEGGARASRGAPRGWSCSNRGSAAG